MYAFLYHAHRDWRYVVLLAAALLLVRAVIGLLAGRKWLVWDKRSALFYAIAMDIQTLFGLVLFFFHRRWSDHRYLEHAVTMLIALGLAHVIKKRVQKAQGDAAKFRQALIFTVASLAFVLIGIWRLSGKLP